MRLAYNLIKWMASKAEAKGRVHYIYGSEYGQEGSSIYLVRYIPFKSRLFSVYVHRFMRSDSDDPHDHPWNFLTFIASKGYLEDRYTQNPKGLLTKRTYIRRPGTIAYRRSTDLHKVILDRSYDLEDLEDAPLTMCIIFRRHRVWGFTTPTESGYLWTEWKSYLGIRDNDERIEGSE